MGTIYHDKICWQQLFGKNPLQILLGGLSIFVSVVVGVLVTLWWCVRSVVS